MGYKLTINILLTINTLQNLTHSLYRKKEVDAHQFNAMMKLINEYQKLFEDDKE